MNKESRLRETVISKGLRRKFYHVLGIILLVLLCIIFFLPMYWMVTTALKEEPYCLMTPPQWIPNPVDWLNFSEVFQRMDLAKYIKNTLITSTIPVIGILFSCPMVAYSLTHIPWRGASKLFTLILATMMVPAQVIQIPLYSIWSKMGFLNTFVPLLLPSFFGSAYYIYLIRQFMKSLPSSVMEAARIDGAGNFRILYSIVYPMCSSILTTVAVMVFIAHWNDYMGPLMYLQDSKMYTLGIGLQMFRGSQPEWALLMAASTIFTLPLIAMFFLFQNAFLNGIQTTSGIK